MKKQILNSALAASLLLMLPGLVPAQPFSSGSTGTDGAYNPTVSGDFDPVALGINAAGDNVFNFTTINIPAGVTIRLRASKVRNAPVVWLATGAVNIAGMIDISGSTGYSVGSSTEMLVTTRAPAEPGAGGYYGGLGSSGGVPPEAGAGPGGGPAGLNSYSPNLYASFGGTGGSFTAGGPIQSVGGGQAYGSTYLVPLYGGSGGGGGWAEVVATAIGGGGGAGGGAIRIVSTAQISLTGTINATGGNYGNATNGYGSPGGPGGGGSVHLIAPIISGAGSINPSGGINAVDPGTYNNLGGNGIVRFNVATYNFTGSVMCGPFTSAASPGTSVCGSFTNGVSNGTFIVGPLYNVPNNATLAQPSLKITQINGANVPQPPLAQYVTPDVQINANTPVTINVSAANIPLGTVPILRLTSESASDTVINCTALAGTVVASTASCSATFPFSISIADLRATF